MAVRVADTLKQQNDLKTFPVAFSEDIWIDQNKGEGDANYKDLQTLYNEGALGGSGLPEPETKDKLLLSTENAETSKLEWSQVDKSKVVEIPLYETKAAAEADIANLTDGQIIATKDEGNENAKPVDVVEDGNMHAVTSNAVADVCPRFPDYANEIVIPDGATSWTATEDCYMIISQLVASGKSDIKIDNVIVGLSDTTSGITVNSFSGYIKKGQTIEYEYLSHTMFTKIFPLI